MASPNIAFESIPASIRKPGKYAEFNYKLAVRTLPGNRQRVLIVGQKTIAGALPALTPFDIYSESEAATYFGAGSIGHLMVRSALKSNPYMVLTIVPVDDAGAGVAATATVTFVGNASAAGVTSVSANAALIEIATVTGDTPTIQAAALVAQIAKQTDLPFTATNLAGVVTLTAKNKGTLGNAIKLTVKTTVIGTTVTPVAFATGATDPNLTNVLATVFALGHNIIITPYNDSANLTILRTHLDAVSGPLEKRYCIAACGFIGTSGQAFTVQQAVNARRIFALLDPSAFEASYEVAASFGAIIAGEEDPALPLNGLHLKSLLPTPLVSRMGRVEQESCLYNGITPTEVGPGDKLQIVRAISMYVLDPQGVPDISGLDITTQRTLDYVAKACVDRLSLRFPRDKKTKRVKLKIRSELLDVLRKCEELEFVEAVEENKAGLIVEDDLQDPNRVDIRIPVDVVNGLHITAMRIDLYL